MPEWLILTLQFTLQIAILAFVLYLIRAKSYYSETCPLERKGPSCDGPSCHPERGRLRPVR